MNKLADIQKLRAFAILMVILGHTGLAFPNSLIHGYTGVSLFMRRLGEAIPAWITTTGAGTAVQFAVMLLAALAVAEISYLLIELPYIDYGKRVIRRLRERASAAALADVSGGG